MTKSNKTKTKRNQTRQNTDPKIDQCISYIPPRKYLEGFHLSRSSVELLESIHCEIHAQIVHPQLIFTGTSEMWYQTFLKSTDFMNVPELVQQYIQSHVPVHHATYEGRIHGTQIHVHFCLYNRKDKAKLSRWIDHVERWLHVALKQPSTGCDRHKIRAHFLMTPLEKYVPSSKEHIVNQQNANTAFTYSCSRNNKIVIFRKEDWFKTFLHETFHCFGLDFSGHPSANKYNSRIAQLYPGADPTTDFRIYESYCEVWAQVINHLFALGPKSSVNSDAFIKPLRKDTAFVVYQMQKYLQIYGMSYDSLLDKTNTQPKYREDTNVFSYYVLRSCLLWNLDAFLQFCLKNRPDGQIFVDFAKGTDKSNDKGTDQKGTDKSNDKGTDQKGTDQIIESYVDLIEKEHRNPAFLRFEQWVQTSFLPIASKKCDKKTRRQFHMTMVEHVD